MKPRHIRQQVAHLRRDARMREGLAVADCGFYMGIPMTAEQANAIATARYSGNAYDRRQARRRAAELAFASMFLGYRLLGRDGADVA